MTHHTSYFYIAVLQGNTLAIAKLCMILIQTLANWPIKLLSIVIYCCFKYRIVATSIKIEILGLTNK